MRVDAPLASLLFAASAAASYSNGTTGSWSKDDKMIADLKEEIKSLQQQLDDASHYTCSNSGSGNGNGQPTGYSPTSGSSNGNGQSDSVEYTTEYSTSVNTEYHTVTLTNGAGAPTGYNGGNGQGETTAYNAQETVYSTVTDYNTVVYTIVNTQSGPAAASTAAPAQGGNTGYNGQGGSESSAAPAAASGYNGGNGFGSGKEVGNSAPAPKYTSNPDYYAPAPAATTVTSATTVTVIVTPGQSTATSQADAASGSGSGSTYTCTETYPGSAPIPQPSSGSNGSGAGSYYVAPSSYIPAKSSSGNNGVSTSMPPYPVGNGTSGAGSSGIVSASSGMATGSVTSKLLTGTASSATPSATANATLSDCSTLCSQLTEFNGWEVTPLTCTQLTAGTNVDTPEGQSSVGCGTSFTPALDVCQVTLEVKTSGSASTYMEVWLPNGNETAWNGRTMSTDNGGLNGCVHYVDMQYVSSMGFAAIGDNAGHNGSSFDGTWMLNNNEAIIDWSYRARHASINIGKQLVNQFYSKKPEYSYYIGCSTGGAQGMQSAQMFPEDFDGIISGASAADFNHLQSWSAMFLEITGSSDNDTFLTEDQWTFVQSYILAQCDEPIDGVADGILEDPLQCKFNVSAIPVCEGSDSDSCLTATQIQTVEDVFKPLYFGDALVYPALLYGSQVDAFRLGLLSGSYNGIARDFFRGGVYNDSSFDITTITKQDMEHASELDALHGYPSAFNADLSAFEAAGKKLMMYHGMEDPMVSGADSQRYYLKVAETMGYSNDQIDDFFRLFRISGMAHCGVGGISGAGAWMFGQSGAASPATNNIVHNLVDWVENGDAPETLLGTKFWYDTPSMGIEFERAHCRFPYRTTYKSGDSTKPESWGCDLIEDWQECADVLCSADGTFT